MLTLRYLITYEDALKLCEAYDNFNFYKSEHMFGPYRVVTFNYFLCEYKHFTKPLENESFINGRDMRGVTFVFNEDGTLYKRFLMLEKFFNVNQVEETQIYELRKKKIKNVTIKEDGSLIGFMQLPNGEVFAKTQAGFTNEQSNAAMLLYNHQKDIKKFVDEALKSGFTPLFEYVSYDNRIVLKYATKELRLIGVRDNDYGDYYPAVEMLYVNENYDIPFAKAMNVESLDELDAMMKTATDMEGVVIKFEDDQLVKWKTAWYFNLHGIRTISIFREDYVIENYLNGTLDDATQELNMTDDADAFKFIEYVKSSINKWSNDIEKEVNLLYNKYVDPGSFYYMNWAKFASDMHKSAYFGLVRTKVDMPEMYKQRKVEYMLKRSKHLLEAKKIVEQYAK